MYEVGLAHKFAYNKKIAHDHLRTKQWARWARVTLPISLDDQAPTVWHPSDPCFAMLTLDEVGTGNHEEFMDAWGSSILNSSTHALQRRPLAMPCGTLCRLAQLSEGFIGRVLDPLLMSFRN